MTIQTQFQLEKNYPFLGFEYLIHIQNLHELVTEFPVAIKDITKLLDVDFAKARNKGFGASDSAVLLGVAYSSNSVEAMSIEQLLENKVSDYYDEEIGKKASVRKGKELEALIIQKVSENLNTPVIKPQDMYTNRKGLNTNFDGVVFEPIVSAHNLVIGIQPIPLEVKVCTQFARKNYDWTCAVTEYEFKQTKIIPKKPLPYPDVSIPLNEKIVLRATTLGIPAYYYTQVQQQILFTNSDHGILCVLDDANWTINYFYVPRDTEMIMSLEKSSYTNYLILAKRKGFKVELEESTVTI